MKKTECEQLFSDLSGVKAAVFDFDGTISTLRCGWEKVMKEMMLSVLSPTREPSAEITELVEQYIDESTGIQTIYQMEWLANAVVELKCGTPIDPWDYKDRYNDMLLENVNVRKNKLAQGKAKPEDYLVPGSRWFLECLKDAGVKLYVASGTDDADMQEEARLLGILPYLCYAKGAPHRQKSCSKEAVIRAILEREGFKGGELLVVGDGKVEITLGNQVGAVTLGVASDEVGFSGDFNEKKLKKLEAAGADYLIPDFLALKNRECFGGK